MGRAIRRELRNVLGKATPSLTTIKRVVHNHGLVATAIETTPSYFPKPLTTLAGTLHALDWTCRYLEDGPKVYAFHTLNLRTRARAQTIAADKSSTTVVHHCLHTWKTLGTRSFSNSTTTRRFVAATKHRGSSDNPFGCVCTEASRLLRR